MCHAPLGTGRRGNKKMRMILNKAVLIDWKKQDEHTEDTTEWRLSVDRKQGAEHTINRQN